MIQIYKPNKSNTGHAIRASVNSKDGVLYINFIKQTGYDEARHIGSFKGGTSASVKFNIWEIGALIDSFSRNQQYKSIHTSPGKTVNISAGPYSLDKSDPSKISGYGISISVKAEKMENPIKFSIPFNFGERQVFIEYLKFALNKAFSASHSAEKKEFEKRSKEKAQKEETKEPVVEQSDQESSDQDGQLDNDLF
jgi:hypothetical protein